MIRLFLRLFGIKDFEICQSCETLKQQLAYERDEKKLLTNTLLRIVSPKVVEAATPVEINPIGSSSALFSRRRAAMEEKDRQEAMILKQANHLGKPDNLKDINQLESELGIDEKEA
jgi:hypothetical protein